VKLHESSVFDMTVTFACPRQPFSMTEVTRDSSILPLSPYRNFIEAARISFKGKQPEHLLPNLRLNPIELRLEELFFLIIFIFGIYIWLISFIFQF
jgi:hypothetical protein